MRFEFATATRIIFGAGTLRELAALADSFGKRALVVTGSKPERAAPLLEILETQKIEHTIFWLGGEPTVSDAAQGRRKARGAGCDFVISLGGGSVLDLGKAVAALMTNPGDPLDYLEVIGRGQPIQKPAAPFIAIPTTAGTGSEVTSNAVLSSPDHHLKVSLRSPHLVARLALVDSTLTHSSPPQVTAGSGLDALTQLVEPFVSNKANPITDALCREGIQHVARSLRRAYNNGDDSEAREDMALAALFSGLALANAKLGAVHGFVGPFCGLYDAPHGATCARLLPFVMEANVHALRMRQPESDALRRYDEIARLITGQTDAKVEQAVEWLYQLSEHMHIPDLASWGMTEADYSTLVEKSAGASSMQGNPIRLTADEMTDVLRRAQ